jgi:hypothetical protein
MSLLTSLRMALYLIISDGDKQKLGSKCRHVRTFMIWTRHDMRYDDMIILENLENMVVDMSDMYILLFICIFYVYFKFSK